MRLVRILLWVLRLGKERAGVTSCFASSVAATKLMIDGLNERAKFIYDGKRGINETSSNVLAGCPSGSTSATGIIGLI